MLTWVSFVWASTTVLGNKPLSNVQVVNELVRHNSEHTCLTFLTLPSLPMSNETTDDVALANVRRAACAKLCSCVAISSPVFLLSCEQEYIANLKELTFGLPATVLVASGGNSQFIASEI